MAELTIERTRQTATGFTESLVSTLGLDMMLVPGGSFVMGSPDEEPERYGYEGPQHEVTVPSFFMGRYPVNQAQWQFVATLPQQEIPLNPKPAHFQQNVLAPVEQVSWYETVEFCARLSAQTGRSYRLPSEAEWEYACRAGTTTPFHFGVTISPDLATYDASQAYEEGPVGKAAGGITPVGSAGVANAFGLYDMHGNVWEWCQDVWHSNYEGAPTDGSAWMEGGNQDGRVLRGGSWDSNPRKCRSACRNSVRLGLRDDDNGFRVVCSSPRALP
jgi:formylglycine-generating enzyme required for sulfatase activity